MGFLYNKGSLANVEVEIKTSAVQNYFCSEIVNTPNLECLLAVLEAAEELNVPVIIAHAQCHESVAPLEKIGGVMVELAKESKVKVCVHLDRMLFLVILRRMVELK